MKCKCVRTHLSAKLDREISQELEALLDAHLAQCAGCRQEWEKLQKQEARLKDLSWEQPGEIFWESFFAEFQQRQAQSRRRSAAFKIAVASAIAAAIFLGITLLFRLEQPSQNRREPVTVRLERPEPIEKSLETVVAELLKAETQPKALAILQGFGPRGGQYLSARVGNLRKEIPQPWLEALAALNDNHSFQMLAELATKSQHQRQVLPVLGRTGREEALSILWQSLCNHSVRDAVIAGLKNMQPQATSFLVRMAYGDEQSQARRAIELLGELGDQAAVPHLLQLVQKSELRKVSIEALAALHSPDTAAFFMELATQPQYRKEAYETLVHFREPEVFRFLISGLYQDETRRLALQALKHFRDPQAIPYILEIIPHSHARHEAIEALSWMPKNEVLPHLISLLGESTLRRHAYQALKQITKLDFGMDAHGWMRWFNEI